MAKQNWRERTTESESISEQEIWFAIRYLDPETTHNPSRLTPFIALFAVIIVLGAICVSLYLRGF